MALLGRRGAAIGDGRGECLSATPATLCMPDPAWRCWVGGLGSGEGCYVGLFVHLDPFGPTSKVSVVFHFFLKK